jgi:hypothetical protein
LPDYKLGVKFKGKNRFIFFVEAKRPGQTSIYQDKDDYVKLMKHMKSSIDDQIDLGVNEPVSFGVLIEGNNIIVGTGQP